MISHSGSYTPSWSTIKVRATPRAAQRRALNSNLERKTPHTSADRPQQFMLAVACCRRVSNMLHLTPDSMVGYSFSASHTLISLHPVFAVQPSVQLCDDFLLRNQPSSWAINLSEPSRLAPRLRSLGHSKAALFTSLCALGWLLPVASSGGIVLPGSGSCRPGPHAICRPHLRLTSLLE